MTQLEKLMRLNQYLLTETPQAARLAERLGGDEASQFRLFRALVNARRPAAISRDFIELQDDYLQTAIARRGITRIGALPPICDQMYLWRGDITTLCCDAIVNAANGALLGCFCPNHGCIDNAIHTFAGVQLRAACARLMQGEEEPPGRARLTPAYNLPSRYILHTVGPIIAGNVSDTDRATLAACYLSCLDLADQYALRSVAFCCIAAGEYHFPNDEAARIAVSAVRQHPAVRGKRIKVIFNVFKEYDEAIYARILAPDQ